MLKKLALQIPQIKRLWDDRTNLLAERERLESECCSAKSPFFHYASCFDAIDVMHRYWNHQASASPVHLTNFLGVKISPSFLPSILNGKEGQVEGIPIPANWHADIAEWAAALRAVDRSGNEFRVVELGCGWGCWLLNTGCAARTSGRLVQMIGVEGDHEHIASARRGMDDNGFTEAEYQLIHGIAAPTKGKALFPIVDHAGDVWGSEPIFDATDDQVTLARKRKSHHILDTYPISEIADGKPIDLLHIDIQGGEADFVDGCLDDLNASVRYMVIGTHSRRIEGRIQETLLNNGWLLEIERPAIISIINGGTPQVMIDGVQGWRNPNL